jgi:biopolymer transport protein ExbB
MVATGSEWVLWLLLALSIGSIAVIIERVLKLRSLRVDIDELRGALTAALRDGGFEKAREAMRPYAHPAARVVLRGMWLEESETTAKQADEAMTAEGIAQRRRLEKRFNFLATLGANAPFIGLFGTVVGVLQAFEHLGTASAVESASAVAPQAVMSSIAEALVATAVGLAVAIPAVFAYNMFQRTVKSAIDDAQVLSLELLSYMSGSKVTSNARKADADESRSRISMAGEGPASKSPLSLECPA